MGRLYAALHAESASLRETYLREGLYRAASPAALAACRALNRQFRELFEAIYSEIVGSPEA